MKGLPFASLKTSISFQNTPFANPVPSAFAQASFAAYRFAKKFICLSLFSDFLIG